MTNTGRTATPMVTAVSAVTIGVCSLAPVGYLFLSGVSLADVGQQLANASIQGAILQTVELTVLVAALTVALGVGCALLVVRTTLPCPRLFTVLFAAPLAVPGFVSSYAIYSAQLTYLPRTDLVTSLIGAAVVMALTLYPYVFLACLVALRFVDPALEEIAASLRPGRLTALRAVVLPALRPAVAAGVLIVSLHVLAEYGAMIQLGRSTLTTKVMAEMIDYGDYRSARSLSLLLAGLAVIVVAAVKVLAGPNLINQVSRGTARPPRLVHLNAMSLPLLVAACLVPLLALGPTVLMTARGLTNHRRSLELEWAQVTHALANSLGYALAAALVATVVAFPVAWWVSRRPSRWSVLTERSVWVAHAVPSAILALALVYFTVRLVPGLYKTPTILVAAYVTLFMPLAVANQRVGLDAARQVYDDVAASLGSRRLRTFSRITLPLAVPGFLAGALLVGLDASKELTTTLMLLPFNSQTLSTGLWATTNGESLDFTAAAPYAAGLLLLGAVPVWLLIRQTHANVERAQR